MKDIYGHDVTPGYWWVTAVDDKSDEKPFPVHLLNDTDVFHFGNEVEELASNYIFIRRIQWRR